MVGRVVICEKEELLEYMPVSSRLASRVFKGLLVVSPVRQHIDENNNNNNILALLKTAYPVPKYYFVTSLYYYLF